MEPYVSLLWAVLLAAEPQASPPESEEDSGEIAQAPKNGLGVSPIELVPRVEIRHSFDRLAQNLSRHTSTVELDIQFVQRLLLTYEVPYEVLGTPQGQITGMGDTQVQLIGILRSNPRFLAGLIIGAILNTASQQPLGGGKQQLLVGGGASYIPLPYWLAFGVAQQQISVAGNGSARDVNQLNLRVGNVVFGKQYNWLRLDFDGVVDFSAGNGRLFSTLEVGSLVIGRIGLFLRAGTQLLGPRQVDYSISSGIRYLFRLETVRRRPQSR
jgi:hypothetical protein